MANSGASTVYYELPCFAAYCWKVCSVLFFKFQMWWPSLEFLCQNDADCNDHGTCTNGTCHCAAGWDLTIDCSGKILRWIWKLNKMLDPLTIWI